MTKLAKKYAHMENLYLGNSSIAMALSEDGFFY